jgi:hypothetical protein
LKIDGDLWDGIELDVSFTFHLGSPLQGTIFEAIHVRNYWSIGMDLHVWAHVTFGTIAHVYWLVAEM